MTSPRSFSWSVRSTVSILAGWGAAQAYGFEIHGNHPITEVLSYPGSHVTDRTETEHGNRAAVGNPGVLHRLPRGREDIREKDKAIVRRSVGYLDMRCLSHRHAKIFLASTARDPRRTASRIRTGRPRSLVHGFELSRTG